MNASQSVQACERSSNETTAEFWAVTSEADGTACTAAPADQRTAGAGLERLQQDTTRMERFLLNKLIDSSELQKYMGECDGEKERRILNEPVYIHQASHAAMGEILGVVAHKWRQPLNSIALIIHNMVDAWKFGEMNAELLERSELRAMEQINLLSRTIDDFRSFLDPDSTTEHFDPVESVKLVVAQLSGWFSDSSVIDIRVTDESGGSLQAVGCQHAFERVIVNLVCNANDAIEERQRGIGPISSGVITVSLICSEKNIVISVEDNGTGIDESNWAHVFEPYFTTKHKSDGFGMGLYMSKLIVVNSMNGNMWFENIPGGARFSIMLPALSEERMRV